jgi:hypothetical protein
MNVLGQAKAIPGETLPKLLHATRRAWHELGASRRCRERLVHVPSARQELGDPHAQTRDDN